MLLASRNLLFPTLRCCPQEWLGRYVADKTAATAELWTMVVRVSAFGGGQRARNASSKGDGGAGERRGRGRVRGKEVLVSGEVVVRVRA